MTTPRNNSVVKAFQILECFKGSVHGLSLAEVADRAGMPVPTAHRFLRTLIFVGALNKSDTNRYTVGSVLLEIGNTDLGNDTALSILDHHVRHLADTLRETAHVAVLKKDMVHYVTKAETLRSLKIVTQIGTALEAYCTGVGKVLLAYSTADFIKRYLQKDDLVALTNRTIVKREALMSELALIRERGYGIDDEEFEIGMRCIAAPIFVKGKAIAALSCSAPTNRLSGEDLSAAILITTRRANMIASELDRKNLSKI